MPFTKQQLNVFLRQMNMPRRDTDSQIWLTSVNQRRNGRRRSLSLHDALYDLTDQRFDFLAIYR
jgi:hypothetical protein